MTDTSRAINDLAALHTTLIAENSALTLRVEMLEKGLHDANALIKQANAERDFYMRQSVELMAVANNIAALATDAASKASHGAYRPNGAVSDAGGSYHSEPTIPSFLIK